MDERSTHELQRRNWFAELGSDLQFAMRQLRRNPGFTALAVVTLALGIGATTAIFSVVNRLLLDPIPYAGGDRIVNLNRVEPRGQSLRHADAEAGRCLAEGRALARADRDVRVEGRRRRGRDEPEEIKAGTISADILPLLGVKPVIGRAILAEDTKMGAPKVVMLGHGLWQRRFGGARDVLGQAITIDAAPYTIVGVMPRDFTVPFMDGGRASSGCRWKTTPMRTERRRWPGCGRAWNALRWIESSPISSRR